MKYSKNKEVSFLRRNAVYLILSLCVLAIGVSIVLAALLKPNQSELSADPNEQVIPADDISGEPSEPDVPIVTPPGEPEVPVDSVVLFIMPVATASEIDGYSLTPVFNSTLERYSAHKAIDFYAAEGTNVLAVYGGTVESVENDLLKGITVTIDHGNGLKTLYNSLSDDVTVSIGAAVNKGDVIGKVGLTNRQEHKSGAHLHFEVMENGSLIEPSEYLVFNEK